MSRPTIQVRVAFAANPLDADSTLVWTDITSDVRVDPAQNGTPITIRRGRSTELSRIEAGTLSLTLNNRSRAYEPEYSGSPYYPNVVPMKRIQVRAQWPAGGSWYPLFTGYISDWGPDYPGMDAVARVQASDAFNVIARTEVSVTTIPPGELTNFAIRSALTLINWPYLTDYVYSGGQTLIAPGSYLDQNTLEYIMMLVDTENGLFFVRPDGLLRFQDRQWRIRNNTSNGTFGNNSGELPYQSVKLSFSEAQLYNDVQVTRAGGILQEASDAASQTAYGARLMPAKSGLLFATETESLGLAQWLLSRYKAPSVRIPQITLNGELAASTLWPQILAREISDKILVRVRPFTGGLIEKAARIEAISHSIGLDAWTTNYDLSLAGEDQFWILQDSTYGVLNSTTKLAF